MDGASGAFAVVALAIQLVDSVQEARAFLKDIQNAPKELARLAETLAQLSSVLKYIRNLLEQQLLTLRLPGTPAFILGALQDCARKMEPLKRTVDEARVSTNQKRRMQRARASTKLASKKEDLQQLERQLSDAKSDLQLAITGNLWQLQMHQLELTRANVIEPTEDHMSHDAHAGLTVPPNDREIQTVPERQKSHVSVTRQVTDNVWYRGILGSVTVQKKARYSRRVSSLGAFGSKPLAEETSIIIAPSFIRRLLELRLAYNLGKVSRTLTVYPVVTYKSPIMELCQNGDIHGLQAVFSSGTMSPFVVDDNGFTLLHHAAWGVNFELCAWLIELGVDPDRMTNHGEKAISWACMPSDRLSVSMESFDIIRLLAQAQDDFTTVDAFICSHFYYGTPEGAFYILSKLRELENASARDVALSSARIFAGAVNRYGAGHEKWEAFIRRMIREGVDIHGRINHNAVTNDDADAQLEYGVPDAGGSLVYGTPVDALFSFKGVSCATEGERYLGDAWLQILSSEGIDVQAYLMEEVAIHAAHNSLTWETFWQDEPWRKLRFEMKGTPSVWWEWCPDPSSHILLAQTEYKQISLDVSDGDLGVYYPVSWQDRWPFDHPEWSDDHWMWHHQSVDWWKWEWSSEWHRLRLLAQDRADRRFAKRVRKLSRGQERSQMPGSWIE